MDIKTLRDAKMEELLKEVDTRVNQLWSSICDLAQEHLKTDDINVSCECVMKAHFMYEQLLPYVEFMNKHEMKVIDIKCSRATFVDAVEELKTAI